MNKLNYGLYLNKTSKIFGERGFEVILITVLAMGSLTLLGLFPLFGFALMIFSYGFICLGVKSYLLGVVREQVVPVESIFFKFRVCLKAFCLKVATMLITFLWAIVFLIPGIVCALNYSFASFVMADEDLSVYESMLKSKKLVYGHRGEICVVYLAYFFVTVAILCICGGLAYAIRYYTNIALWIPILIMALVWLFFMVVFVIPYFELMFANIYETLRQEKSTSKTKATESNVSKSSTTKTNSAKKKSTTTASVKN
ncbi:MAG: DUF975 family protein [Clostridiales bacterium]|nr:DUF975 family protein [Clostridiales bacterium]